jgi:hypothetical protein
MLIDPARQLRVLSAVPEHALGDTLVNLALRARDHSTAVLAAVAIRLVAAAHAHSSRLLSPAALKQIVTADTTKLPPSCRVDLARALAHMLQAANGPHHEQQEHPTMLKQEAQSQHAHTRQITQQQAQQQDQHQHNHQQECPAGNE